MSSMLRFSSNLALVLAAFVAVLIAVIDPDGKLSPDSTGYLEIAHYNLTGFFHHGNPDHRYVPGGAWVTLWPPLYPALIALVSKLAGLSVFVASKLLGVVFMLGSVAVVRRHFTTYGAVPALVLVTYGNLKIWSHTWSEAPFIFLLVVLSVLLSRIMDYKAGSLNRFLAGVYLCLTALFLTRYIGLFSLGSVGVVGLLTLLQGRWSVTLRLFITAILSGLTSGAWLWLNYHLTGNLMGPDRIPAPEGHGELLLALTGGLLDSSIPFVLFLPFLILWVLRGAPRGPVVQVPVGISGFLVVGLTYLAAIIYARWTTQFDSFNVRLLSPGVNLLLIAFFASVCQNWERGLQLASRFLIGVVFLSLLVPSGRAARDYTGASYFSKNLERRATYEQIAPGSVVLFGSPHLKYLRPDVRVAGPLFKPYAPEDETWDAFIARVNGPFEFWMESSAQQWMSSLHFDESVRAVLQQHSGQSLQPFRP